MSYRIPASVVAGAVGPESIPQPPAPGTEPSPFQVHAALAATMAPAPSNAKETVYQCEGPGYMLQLTAPPARRDPHTGRDISEPALMARFQGVFYSTSDKETIDLMERSPSYGIGRRFWRVEDILKLNQRSQADALIAAAQRDPEIAARVLGQLQPATASAKAS